MSRRAVLIVDDEEISRVVLISILRDQYIILTASNGIEALRILAENAESIAAILLDLIMPELNGFQVLDEIKKETRFSQIPVIIETIENDTTIKYKALEKGAVAFVTKPYDQIAVRYCVANIIKLSETVVNATSQTDSLTGLLRREAFFEKSKEMIMRKSAGYYVLSCIDIDNFKVINDLYSSIRGDMLLKHIGNVFKQGFQLIGGICCRIADDNFAMLYPVIWKDSIEIEDLRERSTTVDWLLQPVVFSVGRYFIDKPHQLSVTAMYDRALIAKQTVKNHFDNHIATFTQSMLDDILHEQAIVSEMESALEKKEFQVWYQPQYDYANNSLIGAEALIRWIHPEKGIIYPETFIPLFEKNGFVYEIDRFVWRCCCKFLQEQLEKLDKPLPVSVNISRYDLCKQDIVQYLMGLVQEFAVPPELLRLEVTETTLANGNKRILQNIEELKKQNFYIEIDDFGSGYSSLNILKDVPADRIKLDMKFLQGTNKDNKGSKIIASVVSMIKELGLSAIAEGVETKEQADFLLSVGCNSIQGFFYEKTIPEDEYRKLLDK